MKKVININFSGRVIPIEDTAYESLQKYIESLRRHFANEEGREEIINDIESRIAELFEGEIKKGSTVITDQEVAAVISSMGRPEELESDEAINIGTSGAGTGSTTGSTASQATIPGTPKRLYRDENNKVIGGVCSGLGNYFNVDPVVVRVIFAVSLIAFGFGFLPYIILWVAVPSTASRVLGSKRKKLFRDNDDKIIAGVCSGIGHYFGINAWIPRVLFLLPFVTIVFRFGNWDWYDFSFPQFLSFSFSPGAIIIYIILWLVVPEAITTAEKLEMKGEKVDLNSIKNSVMEEMKGVQQRAERMGREAKSFAADKSNMIREDLSSAGKRSRGTIGNIIVFIVKFFLYSILGAIAISILIGLFAIAITAIGLFPLKEFLLRDGWQDLFAWGTLIFFIGVPIIGIITWIVRRLARVKTKNRLMRLSFIGLWFLGVLCLLGLVVSVGQDFRAVNNVYEEEVRLDNPAVAKLEVAAVSPFQRFDRSRWFRLEPFGELFEDTAFVRNVDVQIIRSKTDSFRVTVTRFVHGNTKREADALASKINFNVEQRDSVLQTDKGIAITRQDKFRNQQVILTVYVPVGKHILINRNMGWGDDVHFGPYWDESWRYYDAGIEIERGWKQGVEYVMQADGLYTLDGQPADEYRHPRRNRVERDDAGDDAGDDGINDVKQRKERLQQELKDLEKLDSLQKLRDSVRTGQVDLRKLMIDRRGNKPTITSPKKSFRLLDNISPIII